MPDISICQHASDFAARARPLSCTMCAVTPDHATASNHEEIRVEHIDLDWSIDWAQHIIRGTATLDLRAVRVVDRVILDTAELSIEEISVQGRAAQWELRRWELGSALWVTCEDTLQQGAVSQSSCRMSRMVDC